jgi:hypothetical protein
MRRIAFREGILTPVCCLCAEFAAEIMIGIAIRQMMPKRICTASLAPRPVLRELTSRNKTESSPLPIVCREGKYRDQSWIAVRMPFSK